MEHRNEYERARLAVAAGNDPITEVGNTLGARLAAAKIPPEALRITPCPVNSLGGLTDGEWKRIATAAEYVVNRWQHPLFGKR